MPDLHPYDSDRLRSQLVTIRRELHAHPEIGFTEHWTSAYVRERLERAQADGDLPPHSDPADLARFVTAVIHGMAVQATGGAGQEELQGIVRTALRAWPQ